MENRKASFLLCQYAEQVYEKMRSYLSRYGVKKTALKLAFWNFCFLFKRQKQRSSFADENIHVLFRLGGGIGDFIINAHYIKAFARHFGSKIRIDILTSVADYEANKIIFEQLYGINKVITKTHLIYDLSIDLVRFPKINYFISNRLDVKLQQWAYRMHEFYFENSELFKNDFLGRCYSLLKGKTRYNQADIDNSINMGTVNFVLDVRENMTLIQNKFNLGNRYITLQSGAGRHFEELKQEPRQWPKSYYEKLIVLLKKHYGQYKIIQIGSAKQPALRGVDINLCGKTSFLELMAILKYAKLHISQEGGLPILRHFVQGGASVVLFGPTDEKFFGFEENINLSVRGCVPCCEWLTEHWMKACIKTGNIAPCMNDLKPEKVMHAIQSQSLL